MKRLCLMVVMLVVLAHGLGRAQAQNGVIMGQLRGSDGAPAAGVRVAAAEVGEKSGAASLISIGRTDDNGRYRLEDAEMCVRQTASL